MLQWMPGRESTIIYNDWKDGRYCSVIYNYQTNEKRYLGLPVYTVSADGSTALTLDFARLHRMRPGYGYSYVPDKTEQELCPDGACAWSMDLNTGDFHEILTYRQLYNFEHRKEMEGAGHKINHLMINPSGTRFMLLHRWFHEEKTYTRLVSANMDGSGLYNVLDEDMASHYSWINDSEIICYAHTCQEGDGYYRIKDRSRERERIWGQITSGDGHPTISPDGTKFITDSYPDSARMSKLYLIDAEGKNVRLLANIFSPFQYDGEVRCDLHPRFSRSSDKVCFDSAVSGRRQLYCINLEEEEHG